MALDTRRIPDEMAFALVVANNQRQTESIGTDFPHADVTSTTSRFDYRAPSSTAVQVTAANATNEATAVTLANDIKATVNTHFADTVAHDTATTDAVTTADATNAATAQTLANAIKSEVNEHFTEANVHFNDDTANEITNADGTDAATTHTLLNEIKGNVNTHITSAPAGTMITLVQP